MKEGWKYKKLGEVATFTRGLTYSKNDEAEISDNIVLRSNNVDLSTGKLNFDELKYLKSGFSIPEEKKVKKGSLLMCMSNGSKIHLGKVALINKDYPYAFGGFMALVTPNNDLIPQFFHYSLSSPEYKNFIKKLSAGANINNIKVKELELFKIPVPSLSEQQSIVDYLDSAFAKIDAMKANAEKALNEAKALFQASLKEMLEPKEGWEEKKLKELCETITDFVAAGSFASLRENVVYNNEKDYAQLVRTTDLKSGFSKGGYVYVNEHAFKYLYRVNLDKECIILPNVGVNCGEVYFVTPSILPYNNNVLGPNAVLVRSNNYSNHFLSYLFLGKDFQNKLSDITSHMAQPKFNKTGFKEIVISVPPQSEQQSIVETLDSFKSKVDRLQANYEKISQECDALKQAILRQVFE